MLENRHTSLVIDCVSVAIPHLKTESYICLKASYPLGDSYCNCFLKTILYLTFCYLTLPKQ